MIKSISLFAVFVAVALLGVVDAMAAAPTPVTVHQGTNQFTRPILDGGVLRLHKIAINVAPLKVAGASTSEVATTFTLPNHAIVRAVWLDVRTAEVTSSTVTFQAGMLSSESGGNATGFVTGLSTASTGTKLPTLHGSSITQGSLLYEASGSGSTNIPHWYNVDEAATRTVSYGANGNLHEFQGDLYIEFYEPQR